MNSPTPLASASISPDYSTASPGSRTARKTSSRVERAPQRDSLASTASHASALPLYDGAPPPEYDSSSSSSPTRSQPRSTSKERPREDESGPSSDETPRHAEIDLTEEEEEDGAEEPDALDLLIHRTSSILSASQSILASTLSSRAQLARFFALDESLQVMQNDVEGTLRLRLEGMGDNESALERLRGEVEDYAEGRPEGASRPRPVQEPRSDPRDLLRRQSRGHAPRVATQHEELVGWSSAEANRSGGGSPTSMVSQAAVNVEGVSRGNGAHLGGGESISAAGSLIRSSTSAPGSPTRPSPHTRHPSQTATSLLASIASTTSVDASPTRRRPSGSSSASPAALRPSTSATSLNSILESSTSTVTSAYTTRRMSSSTNPTSPDLSSTPPKGFLAIHEHEEDSSTTPPTSLPPSASPSPSQPQHGPPSRIRHTRAAASLSLSTAPLPSTLLSSSVASSSTSPAASAPRDAAVPRTPVHPSSLSFSRPLPSRSPGGQSQSGSKDDLSRVYAEARVSSAGAIGSNGSAGSALRERLEAARGTPSEARGKEQTESGGWWWSR